MATRVAIIGGTGVGTHLLALGGVPVHVPTPHGVIRARRIVDGETEILLLSRHSSGHKVPPHRVNYVGIAGALRQLGIEFCLASAAVGCLRREWGPGTLVACSDFYDLTYRNLTKFETPARFVAGTAHVDFSEPFSPVCRAALIASGREIGETVQPEGVYLGLNGPRYETPREIQLYAQLGADLVGMTASSEAIVMREHGVHYGCLAIVTNLAAGISETPLSHHEVEVEMKRKGPIVVDLLRRAAARLSQS